MRKASVSGWGLRCVLVVAGTSVFALSGCDPQVRSTVLDGLNTAATGLSTTFIDAFFQKLETGDSSASTGV